MLRGLLLLERGSLLSELLRGWVGGEGEGRGLGHHQGMLTWGGHSSAHGGMAGFACLGSESDLVHPLSYLFLIIH